RDPWRWPGVLAEPRAEPGGAFWHVALSRVLGDGAEPSADPPASTSGPGATETQIAAIEAEWRAWMTENDIAEGAMAIALPDGSVIGTGAGQDPTANVPVASLSKAITGLCLDGLLADRGLSWDSTLGDIAAGMSAAGVTPRPWNEAITLSGLATHTAGLEPDLTQGDMVARTHGALGLHRRIASEALAEGAIRGTAGTFVYSNTNYAVLGVAIEALSGRSYAETCMERVIRPAGVEAAVIEGRMGSMSSYAGWEISAEDYARLARHWFAAGQPHVDAPETRPAAGSYAMGYSIEGTGPGAVVTHNGRLCFDRSARAGHGATFVALGSGVAFAATWGNCIDMSLYAPLIDRITPLLR
ncbi:serine hydrolase, partial [Rhodobacterales bacterium HKCCSP123]|nr:serine hydrolase [Rhodobacterales bacterium HKCCSP123]